ncbi:hypothetical protein [uncultured Winogradskyella sp.]|uniref:hypothetical protein n=1 Tax=uncultured Winogradskyella sp. TaxID=395353 RepID=UPI002615012E|nr:hypothetical protein [uncultured Winogradskyella sp.]
MRLNNVILIALLLMTVGTVLELYLLSHYESFLQLIPILCIGLVLLTVIILAFRKTIIIKNVFKLLLVLTVLSGIYGTILHLQSNYEFEIEMTPTADRWHLFLESFAGALPALAPLSMIVLALIGYSYLKLINLKE